MKEPRGLWLETTDRHDIGVDLNAPQAASDGRPHHAYKLILDVAPGDVILHYAKLDKAVVSWSRAIGFAYPDTVRWGTHAGLLTKRGQPFERPGWRVGLEGPFRLKPVTLADFRRAEESIRGLRDNLAASNPAALYFPFELSTKRPLRPTQFYLTRFPLELAELFPQLAAAVGQASASSTLGTDAPPADPMGDEYRRAEVAPGTRPEPFSRDPDTMDRGRRGHTDTQNDLAAAIRRAGFTPRSPRPSDPQYDVLWDTPSAVFVCEVKSITDRNEERQLRLALGQVLRYRQLIRASTSKNVIAVIAAERQPSSQWLSLCSSLEVRLAWRGAFDSLFDERKPPA